jgi:hypothetical protein
MPIAATRIIAGFLAGALAVAIFHQGIYLLLQTAGMPLRGKFWNLAPAVSAYGIPTLFNQMFWGGLWGIVFAFLYHHVPGGQGWLKGFLFGMVFPMLLGSWLVVPLIKVEPVLAGLDPTRLLIGFLLNGVAYGIGLGLLYPALRRLMGGTAAARQ